MAKKHYIHNNPYLQKLKLKEYRSTRRDSVLDDIPLERLKDWFKRRLGVENRWIEHFEQKYRQAYSAKLSGSYLPEKEALLRVAHLSLPLEVLRRYCLLNGLCERVGRKVYRYQEDFIVDLATNWTTKDSVMQKLSLSRSGFYYSASRYGWRSLAIGNRLLVRREDVI
jgi:hypothetical protein